MVEEEKKTGPTPTVNVGVPPVPTQSRKKDSIVKQLGYLKAQTFVCSNPEYGKESVKDVPFTTISDLITALLTELTSTYVTGQSI